MNKTQKGISTKINNSKKMHGNRRFDDKQELKICERYQNGESTSSIAKDLDSKTDSIYSIVRRHKIKTRSNRKFSDKKEQYICEEYKKGISSYKLAKHYKCSKKTILNILGKYFIETRKDQRKFSEKDELQMCSLYKKELKSINELGKHFDCNPSLIWNILLRRGINTRSSGESRKRKSWKLSKEQIKEICKRYQKGESSPSLGKEYGIDDKHITTILDWNGVKRRERSDANGGVPKNKYKEIIERYKKGEAINSIGKDYGVGATALRTVLLRKNIKIRDNREANGGVSREHHAEICRKYLNGETGTLLAKEYGMKTAGAIYSILKENDIECRNGGFLDQVEDALKNKNNFLEERKTSFYVFELDGFPKYLKFGISFDPEIRASNTYGYYGDCILEKIFASRTHAFFFEQAILEATVDCAECPNELLDIEWAGFTEVRKISEEETINLFNYFEMELELLGLWSFAATYVSMTKSQKRECERRAGIPEKDFLYSDNQIL